MLSGVTREDSATPAPTLTPEMIERLRQTGIRLDRQGRFWHEGAEVTHQGFRRALLRWLDRLDDGRPILRLDERRYAYVDVEDAELLVLSARWDGDRAFLTLNDGSEEELDYSSLRVGEDNALYCAARGGSLEARIATPAYYVLAERVEPAESAGPAHMGSTSPDHPPESSEAEPELVLRARGRAFAIGVRASRSRAD